MTAQTTCRRLQPVTAIELAPQPGLGGSPGFALDARGAPYAYAIGGYPWC